MGGRRKGGRADSAPLGSGNGRDKLGGEGRKEQERKGGREGRLTLEVETAVTSLAPFLAMPSFSYFRPTMKPVMF